MPYKDPKRDIERIKKWRKENPDKYKKQEADRRYRRRQNGSLESSRLKYLYGITIEKYNQMMSDQGGVCSICALAGTVKPEKRALCVDHDHKTGKIRGLLCHAHNFLIGYAHDSLNELSAGYHYLKHHLEK